MIYSPGEVKKIYSTPDEKNTGHVFEVVYVFLFYISNHTIRRYFLRTLNLPRFTFDLVLLINQSFCLIISQKDL